MSTEDQWCTLRQAVEHLISPQVDDFRAKAIIADRVRDGYYIVKATFYSVGPHRKSVDWRLPFFPQSDRWESRDPDYITRSPYERDKIVDKSLFSRSIDWDGDVARWQWGDSHIVIDVGNGGSMARTRMWSVLLGRAESDDGNTAHQTAIAERPVGSTRGRPRGSDWDHWVVALVALLENGANFTGKSNSAFHDLVSAEMPSGVAKLPYKKVENLIGLLREKLAKPLN